jgi:hypothetical protein
MLESSEGAGILVSLTGSQRFSEQGQHNGEIALGSAFQLCLTDRKVPHLASKYRLAIEGMLFREFWMKK